MNSQVSITSTPARPVWPALVNGAKCRCPNCEKGKLFDGFLKVADRCANCAEDYSHQRADDAPPYFTIFIVGHIIIPLLIWAEVTFHPSLTIHMLIWIPITIAMSLAFLRPIKGIIVALQWANYMHGFDPTSESDLPNQP